MSASIPSAWFAWPVMTTFEEVEVEVMMRDGCTFRTNAEEFDYWHRKPGSDMCDDIMAFRVVGLMAADERQLHELAGEWQKRHDFHPDGATFGAASAIEARSDATGTGAAEGESTTRQGDAQ